MIFLEFTKDLFFKFEKIVNIRHIFCPGEVGGGGVWGGTGILTLLPLSPGYQSGDFDHQFFPKLRFFEAQKGIFYQI